MQHLRLLLWKNLLLKRRRWRWATAEVALPVIFVYALLYLRSSSVSERETRCVRDSNGTLVGGNEGINENCEWESFEVADFPTVHSHSRCSLTGFTVGFTPPEAASVMSDFLTAWHPNATAGGGAAHSKGGDAVTVLPPFATEDELVNHFTRAVSPDGCHVGVVWEGWQLPHYSYRLRFDNEPGGQWSSTHSQIHHAQDTWHTQQSFDYYGQGPRGTRLNPFTNSTGMSPRWMRFSGWTPGYYQFAFLSMEHRVNWAVLAHSMRAQGLTDSDGAWQNLYAKWRQLQLNRFPYPSWTADPFLYVVEFGFPSILMVGTLFTVLSITRAVVHEKERCLKESMRMVGIRSETQWAAWFLTYGAFGAVTALAIALELKFGNVLVASSVTLIFVFLVLFWAATINWCFLISTLFTRANTAAAGAGILWFVSYFPFWWALEDYDNLSLGGKLQYCLLSTTCMALGTSVVSWREEDGVGVTWATVADPLSDSDLLSFAWILCMLAVDAVMYGIVTLYLERVLPGDFGVREPWYFPALLVARKIVPPQAAESAVSSSPMGVSGSSSSEGGLREADPSGLRVGLELRNLRRAYGSNVAVAGSSLRCYENEVTALLGHNGAGKSTTIFMISGLVKPTSGTAIVDGHDIRYDLRGAQSRLGICPQHDILFDHLTLEEHLIFFCGLKRVPTAEIRRQVDDMVAALKLGSKRHALSKTLSGGQKRRLSCGMALVGGSKIVILDEPSAGVDASARRAIWDLVLRYKKGRTILLTTHFMDEADVLANRVVMLKAGEIKCVGSPVFLKERLGRGYTLTCLTTGQRALELVKRAVTSAIPSAELGRVHSCELSFVLPPEARSEFAGLFAELGRLQQGGHVLSYGCSAANLEECFLQVMGDDVSGDGADGDAAHGDGDTELLDLSAAPATYEGDDDDDVLLNLGAVPPKSNAALLGVAKNPVFDSPGTARNVAANYEDDDDGGGGGDGDDVPLLEAAAKRDSGGRSSGGTAATANGHVGGARASIGRQFWAMLVKRWRHSSRAKWTTIIQLVPPVAFTLLAVILAKAVFSGPPSPNRNLIDLAAHYGPDTHVAVFANDTLAAGAAADPSLYGGGDLSVTLDTATVGYAGVAASLAKAAGTTADAVYNFNTKDIVALQFAAGSSLTAWFNGQAIHSVAESLTAADNAIFANSPACQLVGANATSSACGITVGNHPLPRTASEKARYQQSAQAGFRIAFAVLFGVAPLAASFVILLIEERCTQARHVQFLSGLSVPVYWLAGYAFDWVNFMAPSLLCVALFSAFDVEAFAGPRTGAIFGLFAVFGLSILPVMYNFVRYFSTPSVAFIALCFFNVATGLVAMITVVMLDVIKPDTAETFRNAFVVLPNFAFGQAISDLYTNYETLSTLEQKVADAKANFVCVLDSDACTVAGACAAIEATGSVCPPFNEDYVGWAYPGVGRYYFSMVLEAIGYMALHLAVECGWVRRFWPRPALRTPALSNGNDGDDDDDDDVLAEARRAHSAEGGAAIAVRGVHKIHRKGVLCSSMETAAANGVSFRVDQSECFGLLGPNGAGKSTCFSMLTGATLPTSGRIEVCGYDVQRRLSAVRRRMGYCPQTDALVANLTGRETLRMFAALRGVPVAEVENHISGLIDLLGLKPHADRRAGTYSGGNKRKLSAAIALVGDPDIVLLDEPSAGLDPSARRWLWDVLLRVLDEGRTIVLTSHSLEECEALCSRLTIMLAGRLRCVGSPQHLKSKFGRSRHVVTVKVPPGAVDALKALVRVLGGEATLREEHAGTLRYDWQGSDLGALFAGLERVRSDHPEWDLCYSVSQISLEQIFLEIAEGHGGDDEVDGDGGNGSSAA